MRGGGKEKGEVMEGGFIMPSLLRNFTGRVNSQKQLGKCHSKRTAYACVFPNARGKKKKEKNKISESLFRRALKTPGKHKASVLDRWDLK